MNKPQKKRRGCYGCFSAFTTLFLIAAAAAIVFIYNKALVPNTQQNHDVEIFISTNATFQDVVAQLENKSILKNTTSFKWLAEKRDYPDLIKPGRYIISSGLNNWALVSHLRAGRQQPVKVTINNIRTKEELCSLAGRKLELDSATLLQHLTNLDTTATYGFSPETIPAMMLANTYEFWWNTSANQFLARMKKEYDTFWNDTRLQQAQNINLTPEEVITLASIVEEETKKRDEMPMVAGVYLNRLDKNMRLEADPTLKYAWNDFTIRRVLNRHKEIESPYNTYKYEGLPLGPIRIPENYTIDAVLQPKDHDYLYMCAKSDFSGRHAFARTLAEHNQNARKYQQALNRQNIYE